MGRTTTMRGDGPMVQDVAKARPISSSASEAQERSVMQSEVQMLEQYLQDLEDQLRGLGEKLIPVLRPPGPDAIPDLRLLVDEESTPMSRFIRALNCKARSLSIGVQDLLHRIDL